MAKKATAISPISVDLAALKGWDDLNPNDQKTVSEETAELQREIIQEGRSKLAIGEHLFHIQEILQPRRMFVAYLKNFRFSRATAYRYIELFQAVSDKLPAPVLTIALEKGFARIRPEAIENQPPPKTENKAKILEYLESVEKARKPVPREESYDPDLLMKECYNFVHLRFQRLPNNHRTRTNWMRNLVGMLVTELGVSTEQNFSPVAIPESFRVKPGRPKLLKAA